MKTGVIHRALHVFPTAILGALTVFFFIGFRWREPPWIQDTKLLLLGLGLAHAYVIGLILVRSNLLRAEQFLLRVARIIAIGSLVCLPVAMQLLLQLLHGGLEFSKYTLLIEVGLVFFLLMVNGLAIPKQAALVINIVVLAIGVQPSLSASSGASFIELIMDEDEPVTAEYVFSSLYDIKIMNTEIAPPRVEEAGLHQIQGGALTAIDSSRLLLVDGNGVFYLLSLGDDGVVRASLLDQLRTPMNRAEYFRYRKYASLANFRVTDILLEAGGIEGKRTLYVAYHHWDEQGKCYTLNVDETRVDLDSLNSPLTWQNRFETTPCIPGGREITNETGGRLALGSPNSLLLTVGITLADRVTRHSYGKIIEIDRSNWTSKIFTKGHRNPQGLLVDGDRIWSTEHGPNGGDELNLIVEGRDYGWPASSYGTDYGKKTLEGSDTPGDHSTGQRPVYAWAPSIGISNLIRVKGKMFPAWRDDLLVGSLAGRGNGRSLYRVRIHEGRVQLVERIEIGKRVRDLVEMPSGTIIIWDGFSILQTITPASHVFSECVGCHALNKGHAKNGIGPDLWGIVGSPVASVKDFQYSQSMKNFGGRWSRERLNVFLRDPQKVVPGTKMTMAGIEDKDKRYKIIKFLVDVSR